VQCRLHAFGHAFARRIAPGLSLQQVDTLFHEVCADAPAAAAAAPAGAPLQQQQQQTVQMQQQQQQLRLVLRHDCQ